MPSFDTTTPAVVFKLDPNVLHHGGLTVIRSLGRVGVPVYSVHEDSLAPAAHSRYVRGRLLWSPDPSGSERILHGLIQLAELIGKPAVLIPTDDAAAIFLAEHGEALTRYFRFSRPPGDLPRVLAGKLSLYGLCRELGVPCPETVLAGTWENTADFAEKAGFPLVVKLVAPWLPKPDGVRSTTIVQNAEELAELYEHCGEFAADGLMLQEYIPGGPDSDWFFHGYCDSRAVCRAGFTGVKERSYPAGAGLTTYGRCAEDDVLRREATKLLERLAYSGIVDLDFRWDDREGRFKLLDFNPRLGAQFGLFRDSEGVDLALASYLDLTGQEVPSGRAPVDRRFLVENYDPVAAFRYWRNGELGLWQWLSSLRRVDEAAWFARDDLVPFLLMCVWMVCRAVNRSWDRIRHADLAEPEFVQGRNYDVHEPVRPPRRSFKEIQ